MNQKIEEITVIIKMKKIRLVQIRNKISLNGKMKRPRVTITGAARIIPGVDHHYHKDNKSCKCKIFII